MLTNTGAIIQTANLRDLNDVRDLEKECFGADAHWLLDLIGIFSLPGYVRLKAVVDDRLVGIIVGEVSLTRNVDWIIMLGVREGFRRQGIGKRLLLACEQCFKKDCVRLCVKVSNLAAVQLYEGCGYKRNKINHNYYAGGENAFVMEKILRA